MSAALHLADGGDLERLWPLVDACHRDRGGAANDPTRRAAVEELLEGTPLGVAYLIGPRKSPIGYIALSFGHSIDQGGIVGMVDEFYLRRALRGRGIGTEVLSGLLRALSGHGLRALRVDLPGGEEAPGLFARLGFKEAEGARLLVRRL